MVKTIDATTARELTNKNIMGYKFIIAQLDGSIVDAIDNGQFYTYMVYGNTQDFAKLKEYYEDLGYYVIIDGTKFEINWKYEK